MDRLEIHYKSQELTIDFLKRLMNLTDEEYRQMYNNNMVFHSSARHLTDIYAQVLEANHREITFENGSRIEYFKNIQDNVVRGVSSKSLQIIEEEID